MRALGHCPQESRVAQATGQDAPCMHRAHPRQQAQQVRVFSHCGCEARPGSGPTTGGLSSLFFSLLPPGHSSPYDGWHPSEASGTSLAPYQCCFPT